MQRLPFAKYSGTGNYLILADNRDGFFPTDPHIIQKLCDRTSGMSADGVILVENSTRADLKMRIFNADGGEVEMCGNGLRCFYHFARTLGISHSSINVETMHRLHRLQQDSDGIKVEMGPPTDIRWNLQIALPARSFTAHFLNTGVPHTVMFVSDLNNIDVKELGRQIRHHPDVAPTNANFAEIHPSGEISVRTYERGVENETLACGTGGTAVALAAGKLYGLPSPIRIITRSGESLSIGFEWSSDNCSQVSLTGAVHHLFGGNLDLPRFSVD